MKIHFRYFLLLAIFACQFPAAKAANLGHKSYQSETLPEAVEKLGKYVGKRDFESYFDGDLVIVRLDDTVKENYSSEQGRVSHHFNYACFWETGKYYRDRKGERQISMSANVGSGTSLDVRLRSASGTPYLQPLSPLIESAIESIRSSSRFEIRHRKNDDWIQGNGNMPSYSRSDNVYFCSDYNGDYDEDDLGFQMKYVLSNKFVDAKTGRYLSVYFGGAALQQAFERTRVENISFAEESAQSESAEARKRQEEYLAEMDRREAEQLARKKAIDEFRSSLSVGDETQCGYVIELRLPMVEVAGESNPRWMHVDDLVPKNTPYERCPMTEKQISDLEQRRSDCEARRNSCFANCFSQMTTTDISAPSAGQLLCRDRCEQLKCE